MPKDVVLVIEGSKFYLLYQTKKAVNELSENHMDEVNFPLNALPVIKSHLMNKHLRFIEV